MAKLHLNENIENVERVLGKNPKLEIHGEMPITMADAVVDSEEADEQAKKNLKDKKKFADKPFLGATKQPVPKKPVEPKISLDESLFEDASENETKEFSDKQLSVGEFDRFKWDIYNALGDVGYKWSSKDISKEEWYRALDWFKDKFFEYVGDIDESLKEDVSDYFDNSKYVTGVGFDFGYSGNYPQKKIEKGIADICNQFGLEFTGFVDTEDVTDWYYDKENNKHATSVKFDFGHNDDYDQEGIETAIINLLNNLKLEHLGNVDFYDVTDSYMGRDWYETSTPDNYDESLNEDWESDTIKLNGNTYQYWAKVFDEGSQFGINKGRISKLQIKRNGKVVCNYDRGWDVKPVDKETKAVFDKILNIYKFNESLNESYGMPSKNEVAKFLEDSTKELLANEDEGGCCRLVLDDDLCLYVGWSSGFDKNNGHDGWEVCAKIAERNDYDWADFEFLSMPWNPETGDVWDTEVSTPDRSDADWFIKSYKEIRKALDNNEVVLESLNEGRKAKDFVDSKGNVYSNKSRSKVNEKDLFTTVMEELAPTHSYSVKKSKFPDIPQSDRYDYEELSVTYEDDNTGIVVNSDDLDFAKQVAEAYGLDTHMSRLGLIIEIPEA